MKQIRLLKVSDVIGMVLMKDPIVHAVEIVGMVHIQLLI
jgi:hypothetical protein